MSTVGNIRSKIEKGLFTFSFEFRAQGGHVVCPSATIVKATIIPKRKIPQSKCSDLILKAIDARSLKRATTFFFDLSGGVSYISRLVGREAQHDSNANGRPTY